MKKKPYKNTIISFTLRYVIVHTLTYIAFGIFFMFVSNYFAYFKSDELFDLVMKPSDSLSVGLAPVAQLLRGALLAIAIYPFREIMTKDRMSWVKLFFLLFVYTSIGSVITGPGSIEGFLYTRFSFDPLIGYPEIAFQMLAFSWVFCRWEQKIIDTENKLIKGDLNYGSRSISRS